MDLGNTRVMNAETAGGVPASDRVRVRRGRLYADYAVNSVVAVLDTGVIAHVGVITASGPGVLPMAYAHDGSDLLLHGSVANAMLRSTIGKDVCVTVTIVDGLIVGRSPFDNSMNYRSVVVRGAARLVTDRHQQRRALKLIADHVVPTWDRGRQPADEEIASTIVVAVPLNEASVKTRTGDPVDEPDDIEGPHWAGQIPIVTTFGAPIPSTDLHTDVPTPVSYSDLESRPVHATAMR